MKSVFDYETDAAAVSGGRWFPLKIGRDDVGRIKLRPGLSMLNGAWRLKRAEMMRDIAREVIDLKVESEAELPEGFITERLASAIFSTVVIDYELYGKGGKKKLKVDLETFVDIMKRAPLILDAIMNVAEDWTAFTHNEEQETGKD